MRHQWKCETCGATGWARGWSEEDTNSAGISEDDPMEGACEHILAGDGFRIIDSDYDEEP